MLDDQGDGSILWWLSQLREMLREKHTEGGYVLHRMYTSTYKAHGSHTHNTHAHDHLKRENNREREREIYSERED